MCYLSGSKGLAHVDRGSLNRSIKTDEGMAWRHLAEMGGYGGVVWNGLKARAKEVDSHDM